MRIQRTLRASGERLKGNPIREECFEVDQLVCGLERFIQGIPACSWVKYL